MTLIEQFEKEFQFNSLNSASLKHFLETGKVSGSLYTFLANAEKDQFNAGLMCERIVSEPNKALSIHDLAESKKDFYSQFGSFDHGIKS